MIDIFISSFGTAFKAIFEILLISIAAGFLMRKNILTQEHLKALSTMGIRVLLPCLIFSNIIKNFNPGQLKFWPLIPLAAVLMVGFGLLVSALLFLPNLKDKKYLLAPAALQNGGYLILPLGKMLYPAQFDEFAMYCFLYLLGLSPLLWSLGKYLVSPTEGEKPTLRELFSPPFYANIISVSIVLLHLKFIVPSVILEPVDLVGTAAVPVAIFVLGAVLGSISLNIRAYFANAVKVLSVRLIVVPLAAIIVLKLMNIQSAYPLLCSLLVLQASSSPATSLIILVKHYGGEEEELGTILFLSYIVCIITIPFWLAVWTAITA
ncbi:MAG: AEC family transporter [Sedimentisphaerales bacterium]